jgi:hypothetical protein
MTPGGEVFFLLVPNVSLSNQRRKALVRLACADQDASSNRSGKRNIRNIRHKPRFPNKNTTKDVAAGDSSCGGSGGSVAEGHDGKAFVINDVAHVAGVAADPGSGRGPGPWRPPAGPILDSIAKSLGRGIPTNFGGQVSHPVPDVVRVRLHGFLGGAGDLLVDDRPATRDLVANLSAGAGDEGTSVIKGDGQV